MESGPAPEEPAPAAPTIAPEAPKKTQWMKIIAVVVVIVVIIAALAIFLWPRNRAPTISQATVSSKVTEVGTQLTFTAQASDPDGDALSYAWNFGDSGTGTGASATHTYAVPGNFIALLTVNDGKGGEATNDANLIFVTVNLKPAAIAEPGTCPSSATTNGEFEGDASDWTFARWEGAAGNVFGNWSATTGDLAGSVNVTMNYTANQQFSGYWYQAIDYDGSTPFEAKLHLGWSVLAFGAAGGNVTAYAFLDTSSAAPTLGTQVWASTAQTGTTAWTNQTGINVAAKLTAAGTYYLKVAARTISVGGAGTETQVGFDNVGLTWSKTAGCDIGAVAAILSADHTATQTGTAVGFNANSSWAYAFDWNAASDHSQGGAYSLLTAADDDTLFSSISYSWGDGTANTTGTSNTAGQVSHTFSAVGNFFVKVTVTHTDPMGTNSSSAGYTVRVQAAAPPVIVKNPDIFTTVTIGEPQYLDPATDYETAGGEILQNVYETLVWYEEGNESVTKLVPRLATAVPTTANGGISADGKNYTFHIRTGVKFHDGTTMTPADVVFSMRRVLAIADPTGPSWMMEAIMTNYISYYAGAGTIADWVDSEFAARTDVPPNMLAVLPAESTWNTAALTTSLAWAVSNSSVETSGATDVVFHLTHPYPAFLSIAAYTVMSVVSQSYVNAHGGVHWGLHNDWMDRNAMGTGPFKFRAWVPNQVITMDRNDDYWRTPAAVKQVNIVKVNDVSTREFMLLAGDADYAYVPRNHQYDIIDTSKNSKYPTIRVVMDKPTFDVAFFGYNQNIRGTPPDPLKVPTNFFADVHIRRAFSYAFDYNTFINTVVYGGGVPLRGAIPQGMLGYNASTPLFAYDLTKARQELQLATNPAGGGSYFDTGFELILYYNAGNAVREEGTLLLANALSSLKPAGQSNSIKVTTRALDWPVYLNTLDQRALPIFFLGWAPDYADPDDYVFPFLHSRGLYPSRVAYVNTSLDALIVAAASELNPTVREQMYKDIMTKGVSDVPFIWVYQATNFHVERTWVHGYYYSPMLSGGYYYLLSKS